MDKYHVVFVSFPQSTDRSRSAEALTRAMNKLSKQGFVYESTTLVPESIGAFLTFSRPDQN